jgi:MFS family permease
MSEKASSSAGAPEIAPWGDLIRDGRALFSIMVILGVILHALQILVTIIIMPTVVADLGGADYYTWPAMLYTIGSIIGSASVGILWGKLGRRRGYAFSGVAFMIGTIACALAPNMGALVLARGFQGIAGGLVIGGGMALISGLFTEGLRKRILAAYQGTWMVAQLCGPLVGGAFAEIGWWRGSFWTMVPITLCFVIIAWTKLPDDEAGAGDPRGGGRFPFLRLLTLVSGVFSIAFAGLADDIGMRVALILSAIGLVWMTFHLDHRSENRIYPTGAMSVRSPVGLALLILFLGGMAQTSVNIFLPLLLQVVHGVTPLFISFISITISFGWTVGTFTVSGWSGKRERLALMAGPLLMMVGMAALAMMARTPGSLIIMTLAAVVLGLGVGIHNVHIVARTMANAKKGEERITSSAMPSVRSMGTAFGAAVAGGLSSMAGLGDATDPEAVGRSVTMVYSFNLVPLACAVVFMALLIRHVARDDHNKTS